MASKKSFKPDPPDFNWKSMPLGNNYAKIKIIWLPNVEGNPGANFYVKYREKNETKWTQTDVVKDEDFVFIDGFLRNKTYEILTVSVDGSFMTESIIKEIPKETFGMKSILKISHIFLFTGVFLHRSSRSA